MFTLYIMYVKIYNKGSDKMKKIDIAILLQVKQEKLNELLVKGIGDYEVLELSREIDELQNIYCNYDFKF